MFHRLLSSLALTTFLSVAIFAPCVFAQPEPAPEPSSTAMPEPTPTAESEYASPTTPPSVPPKAAAPTASSPPAAPAAADAVTPDNADIRVDIHGTSATDDDYVRVGESESCSIRLNSPLGSDANVVLTSPDDKFRFDNGTSANQLYLTLPGNGNAIAFSITGVAPSSSVGGSEIHAHVGYATSHPFTTATLTVFKLVNANVSVTRGRDYVRDTTTGIAEYEPDSPPAVNMTASIDIVPADVDYSAPQIRDLRVTIVQNVTSSDRRATARYPTALSWDPSLPAGYTTTVAQVKESVTSFSGPVLDAQPATAGVPVYVYDPDAFLPLNNVAATRDSPSYSIQTAYQKMPTSGSPTPILTYKYSTVRFFMRDNFLTYCFLVNGSNHQALRQTSWYLNLDSSRAAQHAIVSASDSTVQSSPDLSPPVAQDVAFDHATETSTGTTTMRKTSPAGSSAP